MKENCFGVIGSRIETQGEGNWQENRKLNSIIQNTKETHHS